MQSVGKDARGQLDFILSCWSCLTFRGVRYNVGSLLGVGVGSKLGVLFGFDKELTILGSQGRSSDAHRVCTRELVPEFSTEV